LSDKYVGKKISTLFKLQILSNLFIPDLKTQKWKIINLTCKIVSFIKMRRSFLLPVQKKRTKEKDSPDNASALSQKILKI